MPHDHHDHDHPAPPALPPAARRLLALRALLVEAGHLDPARLAEVLHVIDQRSPRLGALVVARAWTDPDFAERLRKDARTAIASIGIDPGPAPLVVLENTAEVHNVVVCTLCSCYPRALLGPPPDWYKSRAYRARVVRWPRAVLSEFGTSLPEQVAVRVHDSTADLRYLVIPERPAATTGWSVERLAGLVGRDAMIGVQRTLSV
ncbi:MAG: nitrile hydratase subunit alpha [Rhodobacteraceae bacterium]|nr:nitrile hydratase subunit alpha [Paracoccaceae bacterium]